MSDLPAQTPNVPKTLDIPTVLADMVDSTRVTVDVDDRGRFTVPEPARRALTIFGKKAAVELDVRVLKPDDVEENRASTDSEVDERGRVTIKPAEVRDTLGIRGREATVEVEIRKKYSRRRGADT